PPLQAARRTLRALRPRCLVHSQHRATTSRSSPSLHDALPICIGQAERATEIDPQFAYAITAAAMLRRAGPPKIADPSSVPQHGRSEEHTSELQSHLNLVCRLLLEKKKKTKLTVTTSCRVRTAV